MKKHFTPILLLFLLVSLKGFSQPLGPGSICFLALQTDAPDAIAFVAMQDIAANDTIYFTDNGWNGSGFFSNEQTMRWYSQQTVDQGTVVILKDPNSAAINELVIGPGTTIGKLNNLSTSGEQVLAYRKSNNTIIHLAGISTREWLSVCVPPDSTTGYTTTTCLPSTLTNGLNAFAITNTTTDRDDIYYNIPVSNGTVESILNQINGSDLNWTSGNDTAAAGSSNWPNWLFNIVSPNSAVVQFAGNDTVTLIESTGPQTFSLSLSNAVAVATNVNLQITSIGTAGAEDYTINPAAPAGTFQIDFAPGQTSSSFTVELLGDLLDETGEGIRISITSASSNLSFINPSNLTLEFADIGSVSPEVNFTIASQNITEGTSYTVRLSITPPATQPGNITISSSSGSGVTGSDFSTQPAIVSNLINLGFSQGASSVTFDFTATDDADVEPSEQVNFAINGVPAGFTIGTAVPSFIATIIDNDLPVTLPVLFINEVMSSNSTTLQDLPGEFDDWIEIYNPSNTAIDLAGMYITDDINDKTKYQFPISNAITSIPAGGYILIWADDSLSQGALHTNFKLSSNGEYLGLYSESGAPGTQLFLIDSVSLPALQADHSFGRQQDGELPWIDFAPGFTTPNASNESAGFLTLDQEEIKLFPNPTSGSISIKPDQTKWNNFSGFTVIDLAGRVVQTGTITGVTGNLISMDLGYLSNGVYSVILNKTDKTASFGKLVIQH